MREGNFNRVERAERVEKGLGVSGQELGLAATTFAKATVVKKNTKSAKPWPMVRLGDVCEVVSGNSAPQDKSLYENGVYPFVRTSDVGLIHFGKLNKTRDYLNEEGIYKLRKFSKGSILFPKSGASTFLNHRVLLEIDAYVASHLAVISPITQKVSSEYMLFLLSTIDAKDLLQDSNYPALRSSEIEGIQIPLPPIEVQKEIVERLEKELGEADKVAAEFKRMVELADKEFKAELDETFSALGGGCEGYVNRVERAERVEVEGCFNAEKQSRREAESCPMVRLGDVSEEIRERISVDEVALKNYITTDNMLKGCGGVRVAESVPVEGSLVKYQIGDVLISNIRPYLKKAWLADRSGGCSSDVIVFRSRRTDLSEKYLFKALSQDGFFEYSMLNVSGTKMPRGKREWIKDFEFPLPSIEVQKEIVAKLDAAKERCEKLKAAAERGLRAAENLRKAILSEAFE